MKANSHVPLKKICSQVGVDPKQARRFLRTSRKRPTGRWAWPPKQAAAVGSLLKKEFS